MKTTTKLIYLLFSMTLFMGSCKKKSDPVPTSAPTADFSFQVLANAEVQFTDKSTDATSWTWDFGNGQNGTTANPKVSYVNNGDYSVKLTVKNSSGEATVEKIVKITNGKTIPPTADFTFILLSGTDGCVQLTDKSTAASSRLWDLGNGKTSTEINPKECYVYNGEYTVKLTVKNAIGETKTITKPVKVTNGKVNPFTVERVMTGDWSLKNGTGGGNLNTTIVLSPKNHSFEFEVLTNTQPILFSMSSDDILGFGFRVYNNLGQVVVSGGTTNNQKKPYTDTQTLKQGKYVVVVYTTKRYDVGSYRFSITGIEKDPAKVAFNWLKDVNQDFGADGGGSVYAGADYESLSPRNKAYTFDVTEDNTMVDVGCTSNKVDSYFKLFNANNERIVSDGTSKDNYTVLKLNKGTYTLWVETERFGLTNYEINIYGKVANLKKNEFLSKKIADNWTSKGQKVIYEITFEKSNAKYDINLKSGYANTVELFDINGATPKKVTSRTFSISGGLNRGIAGTVNKGTYQVILTHTDSQFTGSNPYTLDVYGDFKDVVKK